MASAQKPHLINSGSRRSRKLQPHWALAVYVLAAAVTAWAAFMDESLGHRHFVSFFDVTAGVIEFYVFLILVVVNFRHDFILIGKIVLMAAIFLCVALSLYIDYQFVMTLRSPSYKTIFLETILDQRGYVTGSVLPLAGSTVLFVAIMLLLARKRHRFSPAKSPAVIAIDHAPPESFEALPLDSSIASAKESPFHSRRATDKPEIREEDDSSWPPNARQTRN